MKSLFVIVALVATQSITAQSCKTSGTSADEYNYISKGYKVQIESGLDMKKGYEFRDINSSEFGGRKIVYKELIKDGKDLRAIMAVFTGKDGATKYLCIPLGPCSQDVTNAYFKTVPIYIENVDALNFYQYSLSKVLSYYIAKG